MQETNSQMNVKQQPEMTMHPHGTPPVQGGHEEVNPGTAFIKPPDLNKYLYLHLLTRSPAQLSKNPLKQTKNA
jgi:hypothetical protein